MCVDVQERHNDRAVPALLQRKAQKVPLVSQLVSIPRSLARFSCSLGAPLALLLWCHHVRSPSVRRIETALRSAWCKCRLCDFCPKGNEAVVEAGKDAPPPSSPPPPPSADQLADGALMIGTSQVTLDAGVNSSATEAAAVTGASTPANASGLAADSLALVPDDTGALATAPSVGLATQAVQPDANLTGAAEAAAIATAATEVVTTVASSTATANASATPTEAPTNSAQASASAAAEPQKEQVSEWAPEAAADDDYDDEEDDAPAMGEQQQTSDAAAATAGDVFKEVSR